MYVEVRMLTKRKLRFGLLLTFLLLTACSGFPQASIPTAVDPIAIFTSAAQTVSVQMAETAMSYSPTPPATATLPPPPPTIALPIGSTPIAPIIPGLSTPGLFTPIPTVTQLGFNPTPSGPLCADSAWIADITYPDGAEFEKEEAVV